MLKRAEIKPINRFLYAVICVVASPYLRILYNYRRPRSVELGTGPALILGSHSSNLDFLFAIPILRKKRFNAVVSSYFYNNERVGKLLNFFHCIKKEQFRADVAAIREMRLAVKRGSSVLIYPEGEVNGSGRCEAPDRSIVKLARFLSVPIYSIRTHGSYLTRPKWNPAIRRGRVEADVSCVVSDKAELDSLSDDALYGRICSALANNDYVFEASARIPFRGGNNAEGLEQLLYMCPRCKRDFVMRTAGSDIICEVCGNHGSMDEYGFLHAKTETDVIPETVPEWVDLERDEIRREALSPDFCLEVPAALQFQERTDSLAHTDVGLGTASLDLEKLQYSGDCCGEHVTLSYPLTGFVKLPFAMGAKCQFDVPNPVRYTSIRPLDQRATLKFVLAVPVIKEIIRLEK